MTCNQCSAANPEVARFCQRCGAVLEEHRPRSHHYAAQPAESVRALALVSTLMPHVSAHRHHIYRVGLTVAVGGAMVAAGFGILPVALICAGIALPGMLLTYFYDHEIWSDEPALMLGLTVALAAALGAGIGVLGNHFSNSGLFIGYYSSLPSLGQLLNQALLLPFAALILLLIPTVLMTMRPKFRHVLDTITISALSAAAYSLGETLVIQHGAFSSLTVHGTDAARDAFIALNLGFVKPIIYATASSFALLRFRRRRSAQGWGVVISFLLIAIYDFTDVALSNDGEQGVVLTFMVAVALAIIGLRLVRNEAHDALLLEAQRAAGVALVEGPVVPCPNCQLQMRSDSNFCLACGTAVAAMPNYVRRSLRRQEHPGTGDSGHRYVRLRTRLSERTIGTLAGGGIVVAGGFVALLVLTGPSGAGPSSSGTPANVQPTAAKVALGDNLYVTLLAGWGGNCSSCSNEAHLVSPDGGTVLVFKGLQPSSADAPSELANWQQVLSTGGSALFSTISTGAVTTNSLSSNKAGMTSLAYETFTGVITTNQGTVQVHGDLAVYLNGPGHYAVREYYYARSRGEIQVQQTAINAMEASILRS